VKRRKVRGRSSNFGWPGRLECVGAGRFEPTEEVVEGTGEEEEVDAGSTELAKLQFITKLIKSPNSLT